jgi:hypothetical protein
VLEGDARHTVRMTVCEVASGYAMHLLLEQHVAAACRRGSVLQRSSSVYNVPQQNSPASSHVAVHGR